MKQKLLPLLVIFSLLLCSCSSASVQPGDTSGKDDGIKYPEADTHGSNVTYINTEVGMIPISLCDDGYSMLTGENYYYNIENTVDNDLTLSDKKYTLFTDNGTNCGDVSFTDITNNKIKQQPYHALVTSGNWKLCPNLKKTSYTENTADKGYKQFISESFPENFASASDVTVTHIWEYDVDGDNSSDSLVLADTDSYTILAFLSTTLGNKILASSFENDTGFVAYPFIADLDGNGVYTLVTVSGNGLKTVTVYKENTLESDYTVYLPITA